jgi:hypothetical protein
MLTLKRKPLKLELFKPREHQKDALNKAIESSKIIIEVS